MTSRDSAAGPSLETLEAFGSVESLERLPGGRGLTWRSGSIVLRPTGDPAESSWKSTVLSQLDRSAEFTFPRPIADNLGGWVRDGWEALEWIPGGPDESRVDDVVRAGTAFHRAIANFARPSFIGVAEDAWASADRMAWGKARAPHEELLDAAASEFYAFEAVEQVIHGDLLGNVLFAEGLPPAVIDWAPYWRPPGLGAAIAVVDAVCWHEYPAANLGQNYGIAHWRQLLLRALVFRMATLHERGRWGPEMYQLHAPVLAAIRALPGG